MVLFRTPVLEGEIEGQIRYSDFQPFVSKKEREGKKRDILYRNPDPLGGRH